ncbi:MAG: alpha/beta hydrolase [Anaerolineales bacterium]|nr:alpha/beta hydrolase [Anaerolineales bacterium]
MKETHGNNKVKSILAFAGKTTTLLVLSTILIAFIAVNNALHPPRIIPPGNTLRKLHIPYQSLDLITEDDIRLSAWYTPPQNGVVILLAHGYGDNRPEWVHAVLVDKGYGVLSWDARAHGESGGTISTFGYLEVLDVKAALKYALAQPDVQHIGAWGGSMGGATIIRAAAIFPEIEALWIDSSFASLDEEFDYLVPYPIINPMAKTIAQLETGINLSEIDPLKDIAKISPRPVYIVHPLGDTVAPPTAGRELYEAAHDPRFLWEEKNVPHLMMHDTYPRKYERRLTDFFNEQLLGK